MFLSNLTIIELMLCYSWVDILFIFFPISTGKRYPSLLGNFSGFYWEKFHPPTLGNVSHPYWEIFPIPTGKCFPSLLRNVYHLSWERFPILTGKHFPYRGEPFSPLWLGNIYPSQWEIFPNPTGKCFPFSLFNMGILSIFCNSRQTALILQRINSSRNGSKRETFPGWLSKNYEKYSPLFSSPSKV